MSQDQLKRRQYNSAMENRGNVILVSKLDRLYMIETRFDSGQRDDWTKHVFPRQNITVK